MSLSIIILTFNEALHIERAINSVKTLAQQIFVVDSYSTDETVNIARSLGAVVVQHPFVNNARQLEWAMQNTPIATDWVMRLDADEVVEQDLFFEIERRLHLLDEDVVGIKLRRKHVFLGRWIRFGGRYPITLLRIWRRGCARVEDRWMDEHIVTTRGTTKTFQGGLVDNNLNDLTFFVAKHNAYATREAMEVLNQKYKFFKNLDNNIPGRLIFTARFKRFLKERFYNHLPIYIGPLFYFLFRYFFQLGFLDGSEGLKYHFLQGFWYRFLVGAKVEELENILVGAKSHAERIVVLQNATGYDLVQNDLIL